MELRLLRPWKGRAPGTLLHGVPGGVARLMVDRIGVAELVQDEPPPKKRRGRPKGSKNRQKKAAT